MMIFVFGEDGYRVEQKTRQLVGHFKKKFEGGAYNTDTFDAEKTERSSVREVLTATPFLAAKRLTVVRNFSAWMKEDGFEELLARIPDSAIVVFAEEIAEKELEGLSTPKGAEVHRYVFPELGPKERSGFVVQEALARGVKLPPAIADEIARLAPEGTWGLVTELEKIIADAGEKPITLSMIREQIGTRPEDQVFALMDAMTAGQKGKALKLLDEQFRFGSHGLQLLGMMQKQMKLLVAANAAWKSGIRAPNEFAEAVGCHPFVARKLLGSAQAPALDPGRVLNEITAVDALIKTGRMDEKTALTVIIGNL